MPSEERNRLETLLQRLAGPLSPPERDMVKAEVARLMVAPEKRRARSRRYYKRHRERICKAARERYQKQAALACE